MRLIPLIFAAAAVSATALEARRARTKASRTSLLVWAVVGYGVGTLFDKRESSAAVVVADDTILRVPAGLRI